MGGMNGPHLMVTVVPGYTSVIQLVSRTSILAFLFYNAAFSDLLRRSGAVRWAVHDPFYPIILILSGKEPLAWAFRYQRFPCTLFLI